MSNLEDTIYFGCKIDRNQSNTAMEVLPIWLTFTVPEGATQDLG